MAAAQLNHGMVPDLNGSSQHSVKAMLLQKHLSELEKYGQNMGQNGTMIEEIDVDSPGTDSGCDEHQQSLLVPNGGATAGTKRTHEDDAHSDQGDSGASSDDATYCKLPRMIDVETVDTVAQNEQLRDSLHHHQHHGLHAHQEKIEHPPPQTSRNVFSIRNLIYSKDTSDSESAESEDSGNVNSSSGGNSPNSTREGPPICWRPDPDMLHRLKAELVQTLHTFVDTVVSDVVAKVATNYSELASTQNEKSVKKSKKKSFKRKTSNDSSSNDSSNSSSNLGVSEKSFTSQGVPQEQKPFSTSFDSSKVITKFEPGVTQAQMAAQMAVAAQLPGTGPPPGSAPPGATNAPHLAPGTQARLSPMPGTAAVAAAQLHSFGAQLSRPTSQVNAPPPTVNPIRPAPHHTVALQQQAALNAVRQNPLFMQRENRPMSASSLYPYLSTQNYPYGSTTPVNALLQQQDYRRSFLHIDPITGRIKNEDDYEHSLFGGAPQEGLTPHHLKKAKLMFFYCRYPSSNVLKTYFPDVKFNKTTVDHFYTSIRSLVE